MKTFMAKSEEITRKWFLVDASNMPLGRLATTVANILSGKNKVIYTPHVDCGDFVVVINSDKIVLTGNKLEQKKLIWHTGYIGGLKEVQYKTLMQNNSPKALTQAVKGMLQKNSLGRKQITRLKVFKGAEHSHEAQKPEPTTIKGARE
ncbi:MAG: 50S ribosomal protein L13 [Clostridia bacterium]|nr:50S ribosomal protein L13 [Clostridia bacterium]MDD4685702.1 50S ribosomal protein L13 [Clostridia bacterium]